LVLKSPSEHTVNGHHYDIEMQVFHDAEEVDEDSNIKHAATVIFFSVEEFDEIDEVQNKTLQDFFRQFKFEDTQDKIAP
jgi:carbonic anhydrase